MSNISEIGTVPAAATNHHRRRIRLALAAFLALPVIMYVSIIYKIINFGP